MGILNSMNRKGLVRKPVLVGENQYQSHRWVKESPVKLDTAKMKQVLLQGDTHSEPTSAENANRIALETGVDAIVQAGDFAYKYDTIEKGRRFLEECSKGPVPWIFIRGNHDDTKWLRDFNNGELIGDTPIEIYPNVWWCPDGTVLQFANKTMLMVGGAISVDSDERYGGVEYWEDEGIPYGLLYQDIPKADILVSHDAPSEVAYKVIDGTNKEDSMSDSNRRTLQEIFEASGAQTLIHGHYHHGHETDHENRKFIGLGHEENEKSSRVLDV